MLVECYVDGAARGQGANGASVGQGAAAVLIYVNGGRRVGRGRNARREPDGQYARLLGLVSSSAAEYEAVILGALMCWAAGLTDPIIYSDSEMVAKQFNNEWRCENPALLPLLMSLQEIAEDFRFRVVQVPRSHVRHADEMAKKMLDLLEGKMS